MLHVAWLTAFVALEVVLLLAIGLQYHCGSGATRLGARAMWRWSVGTWWSRMGGSMSLVRSNRARITSHLHKATAAQRWWRAATAATGGTLVAFASSVVASGCSCPFRILHAHRRAECTPLEELGAAMTQLLAWPPGLAILLLGVLPTDAALISTICSLGSVGCLAVVGLAASALVTAGFHPPAPDARDPLTSRAALLFVGALFLFAGGSLAATRLSRATAPRQRLLGVWSIFRLVNLVLGTALALFHLSCIGGDVIGGDVLQAPPRGAPAAPPPDVGDSFGDATAAALLLSPVPLAPILPPMPPAEAAPVDPLVALLLRLLSAACPLLTAALLSPAVRARLTRRIRWGRLLAQASDCALDGPPGATAAATAAAIAALIGDKSPREAFEMARGRFCALRYTQIDAAFWETHQPAPSAQAASPPAQATVSSAQPSAASGAAGAATDPLVPLSAAAASAATGSEASAEATPPAARRVAVEPVDISTATHVPVSFISHSWSDCAHTKHARLEEWAARRAEESGEQPLVWIDKACIDQKCIEQDLCCLPIYLAVCERLVVVAGCTYPQRLWCALELFVFLRVTEAPGRVTVLPVGGGDVSAACAHFDAAKALCYKRSDREHVLAVVEAGFGRLGAFNRVVRRMFAEHLAPRGAADDVTIDVARPAGAL